MDKLIKFIILCLLTKVVNVYGDSCRNGAKCIALTECRGVYNGIQKLERQFIRLFRLLRCGLNDPYQDAMICCPPEFLNTPAKDTETDDVMKNPSTSNLLPNKTVCGVPNTDRMLYGGIGTQLDDHSWLALIRYNKTRGSGFHCGGVLISSRYVLTAAHCVKGVDLPTNWIISQVRLGEWNTSSDSDCDRAECMPPVIDVDVEEIIPHSQYKTNDSHQLNDIALLRLARDVPFNAFLNPICLPHDTTLQYNVTFEKQIAEIAGWGENEYKTLSNTKLRGGLAVMKQSDCRIIYRRAMRNITESQVCAGSNDGAATCRGDSGGPLMVQTPPFGSWVVVGVDSYGPSPCGVIGWPRVFTRVTSYMDWIINNMRH